MMKCKNINPSNITDIITITKSKQIMLTDCSDCSITLVEEQ